MDHGAAISGGSKLIIHYLLCSNLFLSVWVFLTQILINRGYSYGCTYVCILNKSDDAVVFCIQMLSTYIQQHRHPPP